MSERLDNLPENALENTLTQAEQLANELKSRQLVSGGNIRFFMNEIPGQYDWQGALVPGGQFVGAGKKIYRLTATAQHMENLFADCILEIYTSDGKMFTFKEYLQNLPSTQPQFHPVLYEEPVAIADSNKKVWVVGLTGLAGQLAKIKTYVLASDTVDITMVEI